MPVPVRQLVAVARLLAPLSALPAMAHDPVRITPLWLEPAPPGAGYAIPALLSLPSRWLPGDAGVILLSDSPVHAAVQARLVDALLAEGAAVLELDVVTARGFAADNAAKPGAPTAGDLVADLRGAARALSEQAAAGPLIAIGWGEGGEAALLAAIAEDPSLAAGVALSRGRPRLAAGAPPMPQPDDWASRARRLCALIANAADLGLHGRDPVETSCVAALVSAPRFAHGAGR